MPADLPEDVTEVLLKSNSQSHIGLMAEAIANSQNVHNYLRLATTRDHTEVQPMEAAAATAVMDRAAADANVVKKP